MPTDSSTDPGLQTGRECARCSNALRPDWNFCPKCALPAGSDEEVLSSQIQVLRTVSAEEWHAEGGSNLPLVRWLAGGLVAVLGVALVAVGFVAWHPERLDALFPSSRPRPENPLPATAAPAIPGDGAFEMVRVPGGEFRYGPPSDDREWTDTGWIPGFEIGKYEVYNAQWLAYLLDRRENLETLKKWRASVPSHWDRVRRKGGMEDDLDPKIPDGQDFLPVRGITYDQAMDFCEWLDQTGRLPGARLPREDEWEKAARGTDGRTYPWGPEFLIRTSYAGRIRQLPGCLVDSVSPVPVNTPTTTDVTPFGVLHMGGNVSEWTDLWIREQGERVGPLPKERVIRGASFKDGEDGWIYARTWNTSVSMERALSSNTVGFRVARSIPESEDPGEEGR